MTTLRVGRFALAGISLALAFLLFRGFLAEALVLRGDEFLRVGEPREAQSYYRRAMSLDGSSSAIDRFAFVGFQLRTPSSLAESIDAASRLLARHPERWTVRLDRPLALYASGALVPAAREFERLGRERSDFRYFALAGHAASRAGEERSAQADFAAATRLNPAYVHRAPRRSGKL